jgi:hypothetical protein
VVKWKKTTLAIILFQDGIKIRKNKDTPAMDCGEQ